MLLTLPLGPLWQTQGSESRSLAEPIVARIFTCDEDRDHLFAARYRGFREVMPQVPRAAAYVDEVAGRWPRTAAAMAARRGACGP
jgi:hypothetical protein